MVTASTQVMGRSDSKLIEAFETGLLPREEFTHEAYLRVVYVYLRRHPREVAAALVSQSLSRLAAVHGVDSRTDCRYLPSYARVWVDLLAKKLYRGDPSMTAREFFWFNPSLLDPGYIGYGASEFLVLAS